MWQHGYGAAKRKIKQRKRTEIISIINPFFKFMFVIGLFPYKLENDGLKISKKGVILTIIQLCLSALSMSIMFLNDYFGEFISKYEQIQWMIFAIFSQIFILSQTKNIKETVKEALELGSEVINTDELRKKFKLVVGIEAVYCLAFLSIWSFTFAFISGGQDTEFYADHADLLYMSNLYMIVNEVVAIGFYINFYFYLKECFYCTNNKILEMTNDMSMITNKRITSLSYILNNNREKGIINRLKRLIKTRQDLLELSLRVNENSSFLFLVTGWISLFEMLFSAYYAIVFMFDDGKYGFSQDLYHNYLIISMFDEAFKFIFICFSCDLLTNEVKG